MSSDLALVLAGLDEALEGYRRLLDGEDLSGDILREWELNVRVEELLVRAARAGLFADVPGFREAAERYRSLRRPPADRPFARPTLWDDLTGDLRFEDGRVFIAGGGLAGVDPETYGVTLLRSDGDPIADLLRTDGERAADDVRFHRTLWARRASACRLLIHAAKAGGRIAEPGESADSVGSASEGTAVEGHIAANVVAEPLRLPSAGSVMAEVNEPRDVIIALEASRYRINGETRSLYGSPLDSVFDAFLKHGSPLSGPQLEKLAKSHDPAKLLRRVAKGEGKEGIFAPAVKCPGKKGGGGFRVDIRPESGQ